MQTFEQFKDGMIAAHEAGHAIVSMAHGIYPVEMRFGDISTSQPKGDVSYRDSTREVMAGTAIDTKKPMTALVFAGGIAGEILFIKRMGRPDDEKMLVEACIVNALGSGDHKRFVMVQPSNASTFEHAVMDCLDIILANERAMAALTNALGNKKRLSKGQIRAIWEANRNRNFPMLV